MDTLTERETEIRFLRRERRLLIDQDQARCRVLQGVLGGAVRASEIQDVERIGKDLLALHLEASGGIERPNGSPCQCILCAPRRDLITCVTGPAPTLDAELEARSGFCSHAMGEGTCLIGRVAGSDPTAPHCVTCANCGVKIPWEDWTEEARAEWLNRLKEEN
jgi:hypothetical protein